MSAASQQEKAIAFSLQVVWTLTRKKSVDSQTIKERMLAILQEMVADEKTKAGIMNTVKQVPLSDMTTMCCVQPWC